MGESDLKDGTGSGQDLEQKFHPVQKLNVTAFKIPTDYPESDGTLEWNATTMILVKLEAGGKTGIGYTYADVSTAHLIEKKLAKIVVGLDAFDIPLFWYKMINSVRNLGQTGISMMAISAVDNALWDLKAKLLNLPLVSLLGGARKSIPVYGSGGFTSYNKEKLQEQLTHWQSMGIQKFKIKIGRKPAEDIQRVENARDAIGAKADLFVDANGGYTRKQALYFAEKFVKYGVTWFEEPLRSDDLDGLRLLRDRAPAGMSITAGEYGYSLPYFQKMLNAGAVDILQADASRCGGITGFLAVSKLTEAFQIPLSSHCCPALHLHVACSLENMLHLEYFHDHERIENMFFDGVSEVQEGFLRPDLSQPGLGLRLKEKEIKKYEIYSSGGS